MLSSCNKVLFDRQMPIESSVVDDIPETFLGEYVALYFADHSVEGQIKTLSKISDGEYLIETQDAVYIDSLEWARQSMSVIEKVTLKNNYLEIVTRDKTYKKDLSDSLSCKPKRNELELDFKEGYIYDDFIDNVKTSPSGKIVLRIKDRKYYLNEQYLSDSWHVTKIETDGDNLLISTTNFSLQEEKKSEFELLRSKYAFEKIRPNYRGKQNWQYFLANSNDAEMEIILDEDLFSDVIWYKIEKKQNNGLLITIGLLLIFGLVYLFWHLRQRNKLN